MKKNHDHDGQERVCRGAHDTHGRRGTQGRSSEARDLSLTARSRAPRERAASGQASEALQDTGLASEGWRLGIERYGFIARVAGLSIFEMVFISSDPKFGNWLLLKAGKQELEIRVTKGGRLRVSSIRPAGQLTARG